MNIDSYNTIFVARVCYSNQNKRESSFMIEYFEDLV